MLITSRIRGSTPQRKAGTGSIHLPGACTAIPPRSPRLTSRVRGICSGHSLITWSRPGGIGTPPRESLLTHARHSGQRRPHLSLQKRSVASALRAAGRTAASASPSSGSAARSGRGLGSGSSSPRDPKIRSGRRRPSPTVASAASSRTFVSTTPPKAPTLAPAQADTRPPEINLADYRIRRKQVLGGLTHEYPIAA